MENPLLHTRDFSNSQIKGTPQTKTRNIKEYNGFNLIVTENTKLVFDNFWLFLRTLRYIGSSGRLVGRISTKFRANPRQPLPIR